MKKHHELKIWPQFFEPVQERRKTFEVRLNDRDFRNADTVTLKEYDPLTKEFTGRSEKFEIGYVLKLDGHGSKGTVVFSLLEYVE